MLPDDALVSEGLSDMGLLRMKRFYLDFFIGAGLGAVKT